MLQPLGTCLGCGSDLPPMKYQGNPRKWCSARCAQWVRRNGKPIPRGCSGCGERLPLQADIRRKWCSASCRHQSTYVPVSESTHHDYQCDECGSQFTSTRDDERIRFCGRTCRDREWERRKRALRAGVPSAPYTPADVFDRDGWKCGICSEAIPKTADHPAPRSASIDHIVPISMGGPDTPENVQAAHLRCNLSKGVGSVGSQLRLVG